MNAALAARIDHLEAERLAPVPRASRVIAVDVDDLALVTAFVAEHLTASGRPGRQDTLMSGDTAAAFHRLYGAAAAHAA